jgi:hypothetical protein
MNSTREPSVNFEPPIQGIGSAQHHEQAAAENLDATTAAMQALTSVLNDATNYDKILLRAAAGAGKSYALVKMVTEALAHPHCNRIAITAFANKQVFPLAEAIGRELGAERACLFVAEPRLPEVSDTVLEHVTIATKTSAIPPNALVVLGTSHKLGAWGERRRLLERLETSANGEDPFDVLMVDEAWQLPQHRFTTVERLAPVTVGVGDVGQLPPIDPSHNPWRGDPGYNPYRAWPTAYQELSTTFAIDLPAVWRPTSAQLPLWRAFYSDWDRLDCVAAPGDRTVQLPQLHGVGQSVWTSVATGVPTLLEVDGLEDPEAPDIDQPLLGVIEILLGDLLAGGFTISSRRYDGVGAPLDVMETTSTKPNGDPLIVVLATRNQAVDDATEMVERLVEKYALPEDVLVASTVDSWQGQTNAITVALHPLSGTSRLDDFNSAFGRLAVTCTRATHGLLLVARAGLDDLLSSVPPRQGTPFGEPGTRSLPRQTHQRILAAFARGTLSITRQAEHSST